MGLNRGRVVHKAKLYAAVFIIFMALFIDSVLVYQVEVGKRVQARFNLEHTLGCMSRMEIARGSLDKAGMEICSRDMRTSITGDVYVLDFGNLEFLYDGSMDVPKTQTMYFTKASIGEYFKDWGSAESVIAMISSGVDSISKSKVSYNYDGAIEWVEYKIHRPSTRGPLIVVQGTQSDEALSGYAVTRNTAKTMALVYAVWLLSTSMSRRRRYDDSRCPITVSKH